MNRAAASLLADYFDDLYARNSDPWGFVGSMYERAKYQATLDALPLARYESALEVGCSIGILTRQLAVRCGALVAVDVAQQALDAARERCADVDNVRFELACVPANWPAGCFDLILLSEVVYYLDRADVERLAERIRGALRPGGHVILVHWTGATDYPLSGDEASDLFISMMQGAAHLFRQDREACYRLDGLEAAAVIGGDAGR